MVKSGLEFILKLTEPLQSCCCPVQKYLPRMAELAWQLSRNLWRGSVNFKINSTPLFTIIFKLKNVIFRTRDFSPLIPRVLSGVSKVKLITHSLPFTAYNTHFLCQFIRSVFGILGVYNFGLHAMPLSSDKDKSASFAWDARMKITSASNEHTDHEPIRFVHARRHRAVPRCRAAAVPCRRLVRLLPSHAIFIRRIQ